MISYGSFDLSSPVYSPYTTPYIKLPKHFTCYPASKLFSSSHRCVLSARIDKIFAWGKTNVKSQHFNTYSSSLEQILCPLIPTQVLPQTFNHAIQKVDIFEMTKTASKIKCSTG